MSNHTPGPWIVATDNSGGGGNIYAPLARRHIGLTAEVANWAAKKPDASGRMVLVASPEHERDQTGYFIETPEAKANARLIAAAPDLLIACQEALRDADNDIKSCLYTVEVLRFAIAKATGS